MANPFLYNVLTRSGAALMAQATSANPLVFVDSRTCTDAAESAADLAEKDASWYTGRAGMISAVSATDSVAKIVSRYTNAGTAQIVKSVCITARLASQSVENAVVLCAKSDPDSSVTIPGETDLHQIVEFPFNVAINSAAVVTVTPGASASIADLDRFVSIHVAGNPDSGEAQSIRGPKTFLDACAFPGNISGTIHVENDIYAGRDAFIAGDAFVYGGFVAALASTFRADVSCRADVSIGGNLYVSGGIDVQNIVPEDPDGDCAIGSADEPYKDIYAISLHGSMPAPSQSGGAFPIGAITELCVYKSASTTGFAILHGDIIQDGANGISATYATRLDSAPQAGTVHAVGKWRALQSAQASSATTPTTFLMATRIE